MTGRHFALLVVPAAVLAAVAVAAVLAAAGWGHHQRPLCKSAISSVHIVGDHTEHGPVVWFPKGCRHG